MITGQIRYDSNKKPPVDTRGNPSRYTSPVLSISSSYNSPANKNWWQRLSYGAKVAIVVASVGVLILGIGGISGWFNSKPSTPTGLNATAQSSNSIRVNWPEVSGATGYHVFRSTNVSGNFNRIGTPTSTSFTDTGLTANTTYHYKVLAYNATGESPQSSFISATTNIAIPSTPTGVTATTQSSTSIKISWSAITGTAGYHVFRSTSNSDAFTRIGTPSSTSFTDTGLKANTTYYYKVLAHNSAGQSSQSSSVSARTQSNATSPATPTNLSVSNVSSSGYTLSWTAVSGATGYYVYWSTSSSGAFTRYEPLYQNNSVVFSNLTTSNTRYYKVSAYNTIGESAQSTVVSASTSIAQAADPSHGDFKYRNQGGIITITGYTGTGGTVTIPATINGNSVRNIGDGAFRNSRLTSVTIPNSVTFIGMNAFASNPITSVTIGANVSLGFDDPRRIGILGQNTRFNTAYYDNNGRAGTYTRLNTYTVEWKFGGHTIHPQTTTNQSIAIVNQTGNSVWFVYISFATDTTWGQDRLGSNQTIPNNQSVSLQLPAPLSTTLRYDIMIKDSNSNVYEKRNVTLTTNNRIVFTRADRVSR